MYLHQGQVISSCSSLCKMTHWTCSCIIQARFRDELAQREFMQQQQAGQRGLAYSHRSGLAGLGWNTRRMLNSILWSLWKIMCDHHLQVSNSKVDCCVVSENRQLYQTPFNAYISLKSISEDSLCKLCSFFLNFQLKNI